VKSGEDVFSRRIAFTREVKTTDECREVITEMVRQALLNSSS